MGIISSLNLIGKKTKTEKVFIELFPNKTFFDIDYSKPSEYVSIYWNKYKEKHPDLSENNSLNGKIFELIISTLFLRENLLPMYLQAKVAFIPNVDYDIIFYSKEFGPISISLKTSLRERFKQADLEAIALKYVHRKSKCYLLALNETEVKRAKDSMREGSLLGLNNVILATDSEFDDLIKDLKSIQLSEAGTVEIITSNLKVTSQLKEKYENIRE